MRAWHMTAPGGPESLSLVELPDPQPKAGWVLIRVKAFGLNRSEMYTRQGHSGDSVTLPRVLGIECVGEVIDGGGTDLQAGQKVACAMGDMGRKHDGGYAEMTLIPRSNVYPVQTDLPWEVFGALPESYLTAWGALIYGIQLQENQSLLIRGGSSSVGMAAISIAKDLNCTVLGTTRKEHKKQPILDAGADHVLIDAGEVQEQVFDLVPEGVHGVLELVGMKHTILDNLNSCRPQGTTCMVGFLGNEWGYDFFPWMPSTVKLTLYSSETLNTDTATPVMQTIVDKVASGAYKPNTFRVFEFEDLQEAHRMMEENKAAGKLVVKAF